MSCGCSTSSPGLASQEGGGSISAVPKLKDGARIQGKLLLGREQLVMVMSTGAGGGVCLSCKSPVPTSYVKECGLSGKIGESLAALVLLGPRSKLYVPGHLASAHVISPDADAIALEFGLDVPSEALKGKLRDQLPSYGFETHRDLFTARQFEVSITLAGLIKQAHGEMLVDGMGHAADSRCGYYHASATGR